MANRYTGDGEWYKGNLHIHTTLSDGGMRPEEVKKLYRNAGYDFIAITDHWHAYRNPQESLCPGRFLTIEGIEIDGKDSDGQYYHVVALGSLGPMEPEARMEATIGRLVEQQAFLILAHPYWTGNKPEDVLRFPFDGIEIYNHVCDWLNGKSHAHYLWDLTLAKGVDIAGIASDDAHLVPLHPGWNGGWIMVRATELSSAAIMKALRAGEFYATTGPVFHTIRTEKESVHCETSPVTKARLVGKGCLGERIMVPRNSEITSFSFSLDPESAVMRSPYLRLEVEDAAGRRAWTNTLWTGR